MIDGLKAPVNIPRSVRVGLTLHPTLVLTEEQTNGVLPLQGLVVGKGRTSHWYSAAVPTPPSQVTQTCKSRYGTVLHFFHRAELGTAWSVLCSVLLHSSLLLVGIITIL